MSLDDIRRKARALVEAHMTGTHAFDIVANEYARATTMTSSTPKTKRRPPMATKKGNKEVAVRRSGFGRGAASNWDAYGVQVKKGSKLEDGVYIVKGGEIRRMKDSNGTGKVCVVYRVPAKVDEKAPVKAAKKAPAPAKKEAKPAAKKVEKKVGAKKGVEKKATKGKK
jgi:hypothetical protein